ncbi:hypothetical protein JCM5296_003380 [Sporobolomyces johnsonii]
MLPPVQPIALTPAASDPLPPLASSSAPWIPVLAQPAAFPLDCFTQAMHQLVLYPEHSSSTILRADILRADHFDLDLVLDKGKAKASDVDPIQLEGYTCTRRIRRRILPKRPQFDSAMEQDCLFYQRRRDDLDPLSEDSREGLVLLLPDFEQLREENPEGRLPYYHPQVGALAFRYLPPSPLSASATLRLDLLPLPTESLDSPLPPSHRLFRTALALLKFLAKICVGQLQGWEKRMHHDLLAGKEEVQDLYQVLKDKYNADLSLADHSARITFRWLLRDWKEKTDPSKHVWEDVAIAAWLICVWRGMYPATEGKPPGGFVDVGCGNGLLVYILTAEGYPGYGLDLRQRKSWSLYTSPVPDLRVSSLSPPSLLSLSFTSNTPPFPPNSFLIGNHADELTPWIPLFAAQTPGASFLNIPCCLHELVGRFERPSYEIPPEYLASLPAPPTPPSSSSTDSHHPLLLPFFAPSPLPASHSGRYHAYQLYLAHLSLQCGFVPEREALRIPSTKNFGILGRRRTWDVVPARGASEDGDGEDEKAKRKREVRDEVWRLVQEVEARGAWKARTPEGKAGEH